MATTYIHARIGVIDANGDTVVIYPQATAGDVSISRASNDNIPSTISNVQQLVNALAVTAFETNIDDSSTASTKTWSAYKINQAITNIVIPVNPSTEPTADGSIWVVTE